MNVLNEKIKVGAAAMMALFFTGCTTASTAQPPKHFKEVGGSNYVMYDVSDEYLKEGKGWYKPGVLQPVVATFHQQDKLVVLEQLKAMHASGQQKISILIWHDHLKPKDMGNDGVHGHVLASNGGALRPQHAQNLKDQLAMVRNIGFNELIFRFAQQGDAWPQVWEKWNEEAYLENKAFIFSTRQLVLDAMKGSDMKLTFDLGAELGGIEKGQITPYTERLWRDYTEVFGADDTFGFSIAGHPTRIRRWIGIADKVGVRPSRYALDMYGYIPEWMPKMIPEFAEAGIDDPKIIILETYWNDAQALKDLQQIATDFDFEYEFLMQWPLLRGAPHPHFSDVFEKPEYDAYLNTAE